MGCDAVQFAVYIYNFGGTFCFRTLKIEVAGLSETLLSPNDITRRHTAEDCNVGESECKQNPHPYYYIYKRTQNVWNGLYSYFKLSAMFLSLVIKQRDGGTGRC